jgi:hypothetical protein
MLEINNKEVDETTPKNRFRIITGTLMLMGSLTLIVLIPKDFAIGTILFSAGLVFLVTGILRHRKYGDGPESDERSKRIGAYGLSCAWLAGIFFMVALFFADYLGMLRLSAQVALAVSIGMLALFALIIQMYFFRKGGPE